MNDFRSYSNAKNSGSTPPFDGNGSQPDINDFKIPGSGDTPPGRGDTPLNNTVEMAKIIAQAMNGKSTAQVMQTIIAEAERGKREGTLTNAELDNFYNTLSPILDGAKKRKLKQVITRLKEI